MLPLKGYEPRFVDTPDKKAFVVDETRSLSAAPESALAESEDKTVVIKEKQEDDIYQSGIVSVTSPLPHETFAERYEILELIGRGGTGAVYRVRHLHLDKYFALKILYTNDANKADTIKRFQQEAKFSTRLDHPGIVRVHDFGVHEGKPYMVMDLLSGESLSELIKTKKLSQERLLRVFGLILNALAHAHDKSIIHRDIKPGNILVGTDENGEDQVTLVDLGIAKELDRSVPQEMNLTKTGEIFGTPLYMSPEQCCGTPVDARSDIYSLGCVMYECLTGSPPFIGETVFEIINKHMNEAPPPFSSEIRNTKLGGRLEAVVLKALAKDKSHRYQFALEMASELKQIELHQGSVITDMKLYWKLYAGRMNAVQRGTALSTWFMCILSVCAVAISVSIFYLRPQIEAEFRGMRRNAHIIRILGDEQIGSSHSLNRKHKFVMLKKIANLKIYSHLDPAQEKLVLDFEKDYHAAVNATEGLMHEADKSFENMSILGLKALYERVENVAQPWTKESQSRALAYGYSFQRYKQLADQLGLHLFIFSLLPYLGSACLLGLFVLLAQRFRSRMATKKAYDKALQEQKSLEESPSSSTADAS